jgi:hypothetical protein
MEESKIERRLKQEVTRLGGLCLKFSPIGCAGAPDRIAFLPGGSIYLVELKARRGKLSALQKARIKQYERLNFKVRVICDGAALKVLLEEMTNEIRAVQIPDRSD